MATDHSLIMDALPGLAWLQSADGSVEFMNRRWCEYTGIQNEYIDPPPQSLWPWAKVVHPDDFPTLADHWSAAVAQGMPIDTEARLKRHSGEYRWFLFRSNPLFDERGTIIKWYGTNIDVEDRKRAEQALRESAQTLAQIINTIPTAAWSTKADGYCDFLHQRWLEYTGFTAAQAEGWGWRDAMHPDDVDGLVAHWQHCLATGTSVDTEARIRRYDGEYRWFLFRGNPLRDDDGNIIRWYGTNVDIEDRKRAETALAESERLSRQIINTIPALIITLSSAGTTDSVNQQFLDYTGQTIASASNWITNGTLHDDDLANTTNAFNRALEANEPFDFELRLRRVDGSYRWFQLRGTSVTDREGSIVRWYGLLTDIDDRKRAEEAVKASEINLRKIINTLPTTAWSTQPDGYCDFLSDRWLDYAGFTHEEAVGWAWASVIHPEDADRLEDYWRGCLEAGTPVDVEARMRRFDGEYRWFLFRANPLRDQNGTITKWYGTNIDIEDRKRADEALRSSEINLRKIINTLPTTAWTTRPDGYCDFLSDRWLEYAGYTHDEAEGWAWAAVIHPDDAKPLEDYWLAALANGTPVDTEARMRRFDGEYRWFLFRANPLRDQNGTITKWYGTNIDIEDRKRADEALRSSELNLRKIINAIPTTAWSTRPDGYCDFLNDRWLDYAGFTHDDAEGWAWAAVIHPVDAAGLETYWKSALTSGTPVDTEARMRRYDGEYRWFLFRANPLRDEKGDIVKWYGTNIDIEDRKRAEQALRESERQSRMIVNTIPGLVAVFNADGSPEDLNEQFLAYLGQTIDEFTNWPSNGTVHPDDLTRHIETLSRSLNSGQPIDFETRLRRFDGEYRWFQLRGRPSRDIDGHIVRWYCLMTDVDDRRRAEDQLRRSETFMADAQKLSRTGSFSWKINGDEIVWSDETYRIYGFDPSTQMTLELLQTRVHPDSQVSFSRITAGVREGSGDFDYETQLMMPDKTVKKIRVVAHRERNKDGDLELRGAVQDVTEARAAEEALNKARSELAHVNRMTSLGALTASIAHEVNQPLAGIIMNATTCLRVLAADPPDIEAAMDTAKLTLRDANRAAEVIVRLRALFARKPVLIEAVDLSEAVREVVALSTGDLQRTRIHLRTELDESIAPVAGDRVQLQQVILNLMRNAAEAMAMVKDHQRRLVIKTGADDEDHVRLSVQDTGVGFDTDDVHKIFEPFYTTKQDGMGIGLSVCRSIIEKHKGRLWAERNEGPGATVSFSIPRFPGPTSDALSFQSSDVFIGRRRLS
ncbi:PAS domain S-box-containing protein [Rhizobium sp. BK181]|uniref:PAS domain-containing protein n=1 Tax=Rhizobium sp. BK181 TaxID=2587072 RepID=UPI001607233F|nr:PAS domain-containing protein [Rhizobium sp. BK181]MBB3314622.1 PAS domain S-box-containing protein [Rhizobium sp. BK181]